MDGWSFVRFIIYDGYWLHLYEAPEGGCAGECAKEEKIEKRQKLTERRCDSFYKLWLMQRRLERRYR